MEGNVKAHLIILGRVQGVYFRAETKKAADNFGVNGWVRNKQDGTVEAVAEGDKLDVTSLVNWCHKGSPLASVDKVKVTWKKYTGEFREFKIVY